MSNVHDWGVDVDIIQTSKGIRVRLNEEIGFITPGLYADAVPVGFVSDLASIPPVLRWIFKKFDSHLKAAIIHDYLCEIQHDKSDADEMFLRQMKRDGVSWWKRTLMYRGVRLYSPFRKGKA